MSGRYYKYGPKRATKKALSALAYSSMSNPNDSAKKFLKEYQDMVAIREAIRSIGNRKINKLKIKKAKVTLTAFQKLIRK